MFRRAIQYLVLYLCIFLSSAGLATEPEKRFSEPVNLYEMPNWYWSLNAGASYNQIVQNNDAADPSLLRFAPQLGSTFGYRFGDVGIALGWGAVGTPFPVSMLVGHGGVQFNGVINWIPNWSEKGRHPWYRIFGGVIAFSTDDMAEADGVASQDLSWNGSGPQASVQFGFFNTTLKTDSIAGGWGLRGGLRAMSLNITENCTGSQCPELDQIRVGPVVEFEAKIFF